MPAAANYVTSYFLVFFVGALVRSCIPASQVQLQSIAKTLAKVCVEASLLHQSSCAITGLLTYGGVSGFVVFFVIYPIALQHVQTKQTSPVVLSRVLSLAGCWTWSMYGTWFTFHPERYRYDTAWEHLPQLRIVPSCNRYNS